ncbi:hypothetical protein niasHT_028525 [Heterodera trifolii]|uniref:Uncharacterized protein n=1 Tax=Heterodera trifolii TaxID=157864 RepID=A0ABD2KQ70_9BILA
MNRRWICADVWMALFRFLTMLNLDLKWHFFLHLHDHFIIAFLRSNQQIWDKGTHLGLYVPSADDDQPIWSAFARGIWPIFAPNIHHLKFAEGHDLESLRRLTSPTILSDLNKLNSINSGTLLPDAIGDDEPNAISAGQTLSKWLHFPRKDGQPKRLFVDAKRSIEWVNNLKELFVRATTSASYKIQFTVYALPTTMMPFELMNGRTNEKLTLKKEDKSIKQWIMRRCQMGRRRQFGATTIADRQLRTGQLRTTIADRIFANDNCGRQLRTVHLRTTIAGDNCGLYTCGRQLRTTIAHRTFADDNCGRQLRTVHLRTTIADRTFANDNCGRQLRTVHLRTTIAGDNCGLYTCGRQLRTVHLRTTIAGDNCGLYTCGRQLRTAILSATRRRRSGTKQREKGASSDNDE